jgi:hypothetical protein
VLLLWISTGLLKPSGQGHVCLKSHTLLENQFMPESAACCNGFVEEQDRLLLKSIYGEPGVAHLRQTLQDDYLTWFNTAEVTEKERARQRYATPEQCKQNVLLAIDAEIDRLKQCKEEHNSIESKRREVEILRQRVPDSPGLDRLLRRRNSLEREFDRLLAQVERIQRISDGQPPPREDDKIS